MGSWSSYLLNVEAVAGKIGVWPLMAQMHVMKDADAAEWALRVDLAATFRLSAREKWNEGIGNHNSAMIVNTEYMLINPRGMIFHENPGERPARLRSERQC